MFHHKGWIALTFTVILIGYIVGGLIPFLIHYHDWFSSLLPKSSKIYICSFLIGLLGANVQNSIFFARECNAIITEPDTPLPTPLDAIGHFLKQIWGGLAAVFFIAALNAGFFASFTTENPVMRKQAIIVVSFVAGLRAYSIIKKLSGIIQ